MSAVKKKKTAVKKKAKARSSKVPTVSRSRRVLSDAEPGPFQIVNQKGAGVGLIICDHASSRVPRALKGLGIPKPELLRHIGWDIGTEDVGRHLAKELDFTLVLANYSRLVVDLNRAPHHPECIPDESDGTKIPANTGLTKKQKDQRLKEIFVPYQNQIAKEVARQQRKGAPFLLSVHSFTPQMNGIKRPWHISILWNKQEKIAKALIAEIRRQHPNLLIGSNEPYTLKDERFVGSTMQRHAEERNLPYIFVEFRQDLIGTKEAAIQWANVFLQALRQVLGDMTPFAETKSALKRK